MIGLPGLAVGLVVESMLGVEWPRSGSGCGGCSWLTCPFSLTWGGGCA